MLRSLGGSVGNKCKARAVPFVVLPLALCLLFAKLSAQVPPPASPTKTGPPTEKLPTVPTTTPEMTAADLGAFLDGVMPLELAREDIAGAVVLVVKDGKVLFTKGYGYADVSKRTPVSAESTFFRPGSISKLFTWRAVMQLVEQGKIGLDRDVNDYLDFKIAPEFGKPVTMRDLMTHTPGFEDGLEHFIVANPSDLEPLGYYLKTHQPQRIFPPRITPAYSNYGTTLAGYIVERVSGLSFNDYVEQNIFVPLGMTHSTFRQPPPDSFRATLSNGYQVASQPAKPFELFQPWPAGGVSMTAPDMASFMVAQLQDGQFDGKRILRPETARLMHARAFENLPTMNGMALGFYEEIRNGKRIIGHGGDTLYFHSDLHLIPDAGVGFFISFNSTGVGKMSPRSAVWEAFLDRYFPYELPAAETVTSAAQDARTVAGHYLCSRRFETTIMKLFSDLDEVKVYPNSDGTISASYAGLFTDLNGNPKHFREIKALLFRDDHGQDRIAFKRDDTGELIMVIDYPFMVFQRAHLGEDSQIVQAVLVSSVAVLLLTLLLWPIGALLRWHYGKKLALTPQQRWLRILVRIVCACDLILAFAFIAFFLAHTKDLSGTSVGAIVLLRLSQLLGWLGTIGLFVVFYNTYRAWADRDGWLLSKLGYSLLALAGLGWVWFALTFHLLGWNLHY